MRIVKTGKSDSDILFIIIMVIKKKLKIKTYPLGEVAERKMYLEDIFLVDTPSVPIYHSWNSKDNS